MSVEEITKLAEEKQKRIEVSLNLINQYDKEHQSWNKICYQARNNGKLDSEDILKLIEEHFGVGFFKRFILDKAPEYSQAAIQKKEVETYNLKKILGY